MTTIAFDGKCLAADRRATSTFDLSGSLCSHCNDAPKLYRDTDKIHLLPKNKAFPNLFGGEKMLCTASFGSLSTTQWIRALLLKGISPADVLACCIDNVDLNVNYGGLLMITNKAAYTCIVDAGLYTKTKIDKYPVFIGSGGVAANLIHSCFRFPIAASVATAGLADSGTGTEVDYVDLQAHEDGTQSVSKIKRYAFDLALFNKRLDQIGPFFSADDESFKRAKAALLAKKA